MPSSIQSKLSNNPSIALNATFQFAIWLILSLFIMCTQRAFEVSEAREGVVVQEILEYNTWILPLRHGELIPSKPPLFHWISAFFSQISGGLNDFTLRLPSILCGFLMALVTYLFARRQLGDPIAALALSFMLTSYCFLQMSTDGRVDMLFCSILHCALFYFLSIFADQTKDFPSKKDQLVVGTLLGLSVLAKGPLGPVLFLVACAPLLFSRFGLKIFSVQFLRSWFLNLGLLPILLIPLPWYYLAYMAGNTGFVSKQLIFENIDRFLGRSGIPAKPIWFYFQHLFTQTPISAIAILIFGFCFLYKDRNKLPLKTNENNTIKTIGLQALSLIIFLSLSSGKRRAYLLPIVPHLAIIASILFNRYITTRGTFDTKYLDGFVKLLFGGTIVIHLFKLFLPFFSPFKNSFLIGLLNLPLSTSIGIIGILLCLIILNHRLSSERSISGARLALYSTNFFLIIYLALPIQFYLTKGYSHSYYVFASELKEYIKSLEKITFIKKRSDESLDTLFFYYGTRIFIHDLTPPTEEGLYLARARWFRSQTKEFQANCTTLLEGGRQIDDNEKGLILFKIAPKDQDRA